MLPSQSNRSGSAILDGAPPSPPDRIFPRAAKPGDDTNSLLGDDSDESDSSGAALKSAGNKLLLGVSMMMQATNVIESVSPGFVPEPVKQWIAKAMTEGPLMAKQLSQQGDPSAMLSAIGGNSNNNSNTPGAPSGTSPMSMPAMSMSGNAGGGSGGGVGGSRQY